MAVYPNTQLTKQQPQIKSVKISSLLFVLGLKGPINAPTTRRWKTKMAQLNMVEINIK
jgi:hypothetical protein